MKPISPGLLLDTVQNVLAAGGSALIPARAKSAGAIEDIPPLEVLAEQSKNAD